MLLSVIIPTCNRNELLGKCLDRLMPGTQTLAADAYEVIVSDDGAGEGAETFCRQRYPWVRYVRGPRRGPAANRNNGAGIAAGDWLVFTDDDCLPDAGWLHAYVCAIDAYPDCKAFEGAIWPDDEELLKKDMAECPVNKQGGCFWSANIMVERPLFQSIGGFDEQFLIAAQEDQDLHWRLQALTPLVFASEAQVLHPVRVVDFRQKVTRLPPTILNWWKLTRKQKSVGSALYEGYRSQMYAGFVNLSKRKWKTFSLNLLTIVLLLPVLVFANRST